MADPGRRPDDDATPGREQTPAEPGTAAPEAADRDAATPATPSEQASAPAASQAPIGPDEPVVPGAPAPVEVPDRTVEPVPAEPAPVEPVPAKPVPAEPAPGEPDRPAPHIAPAPPDAAGATVPIAPVPGAAMAAAVTESATHAEPDEGTRAAEDERAEQAEPAEPRRRSWLPIALLALLAIVAVAGTAYLAIRVREHQRTEDARAEALEASREAAQLLFSYNHETLQEDFEAGLATTTGEFREEYQQTTAEVVTPVATEYDAVVEAEVAEAGVVSASPEHVVTIVYLNQATTSTRVEGQKIDQSRVRMHMRLVDGEWLVEQVDAL